MGAGLCRFASDSRGRSVPNRGPPRTCAAGKGDAAGTVYELVDCPGCGLYEARPPAPEPEPGATGPKPPAGVADCPHRSAEPVGVEGCGTCRGRVELKVFGCDLHVSCTIAKPLAGRRCCATCADRPA